jgi:hypothetical protein
VNVRMSARPRERTFGVAHRMSAKCQHRTSVPAHSQTVPEFSLGWLRAEECRIPTQSARGLRSSVLHLGNMGFKVFLRELSDETRRGVDELRQFTPPRSATSPNGAQESWRGHAKPPWLPATPGRAPSGTHATSLHRRGPGSRHRHRSACAAGVQRG